MQHDFDGFSKTGLKVSWAQELLFYQSIKNCQLVILLFSIHISGTGNGKDMPAGSYDMHTVEVVRFSNGKAVEHWGYMEMGEVTKMMMAPMPGMDKMKAPAKKK